MLKLLELERPSALATVTVMVAFVSEGVDPQAGAVQVTSVDVLVLD
jgi:hypothetical protein